MKSIISIWVSFVMLFVNFVPGFVSPKYNSEDTHKSYPYVFVHGFLGWGEDEGIEEDLPYWGATACNLAENLNKEGYECYNASVGPFSSAWDRACELYAQIVGTRVDYGKVHSEKYNHLRYGRTYEKPMIEGWGDKDENGLINKVNLIGHSFGGNTVRLLAYLLKSGCAEEVEATSSDDISPLFTGGKEDWVNSLVAICSPHNGSTLKYIVSEMKMIDFTEVLLFLYAGILGRSPLNGYVDFHLEQFGLTYIPGQKDTDHKIRDAIKDILSQKYDNIAYDLSPDGCKALNDYVDMSNNVYYFSYAFRTTRPDTLTGSVQLPIPSTLGILLPFSTMMGMYSYNRETDFPIDKSWLPNDGLVNVVSAVYPQGDKHVDYNPNSIEKGIWNVMPISTGDHGSPIGLGVSEEYLMNYYRNMLNMIEALPVTN